MRRFGSLLAVFTLVLLLVITEIVIIKSASKYEPQISVVFAKTRIPERTVITPDMLELRDVNVSYVHRMSLRNISDAAAKRAGMDIDAGEMVLSGKLKPEEMEVIEVKDRNKKLFAVEFKGDQANGWWLMTDQVVDIIYIPNENPVNGTAPGNKVRDDMQVLEDIRIAALIDENGKLLKNKDRTSLPRYISFEVTDEQVGFLAYAKGHGRLELSVVPGP